MRKFHTCFSYDDKTGHQPNLDNFKDKPTNYSINETVLSRALN